MKNKEARDIVTMLAWESRKRKRLFGLDGSYDLGAIYCAYFSTSSNLYRKAKEMLK